MNNSNKGTGFLKELRNFIAFLNEFWRAMAGISVFFPFANIVIKKIPMEEYVNNTGIDGGLAGVSADLLTVVATFISLFIIIWTYGQRHEIKSEADTLRRQAIFSLAFGIIALSIYLFIYNLTKGSFWGNWLGWENPLTGISFGLSGIVCLVSYSAFFSLITRAFILLGMIEYFTTDA